MSEHRDGQKYSHIRRKIDIPNCCNFVRKKKKKKKEFLPSSEFDKRVIELWSVFEVCLDLEF